MKKEQKTRAALLKRVACLGLSLITVAAFCGCTTYDNFKNTFITGQNEVEDVIYFGVYEPLSGPEKNAGAEEVKGLEIAHEQISHVLGKKIELIYADNKSNIYEAKTALDELFQHDITFLFGSYGETLTLFAGDYMKANDCPGITITSTNPLITNNNPYFFTATYSESRQGLALAECATTGYERNTFSVVRMEGDDVASEIIRRFTSRIEKNLGSSSNIKKTYTLNKEKSNYNDIIAGLMENPSDCVLLTLDKVASLEFFEKAKEAGYTSPLFLGTDCWNDDGFQTAVNNLEGFAIAYPKASVIAENSTYENSEFIRLYHEKYGEDSEPSLACATAYDSYMLAIKAIEDAYYNVSSWDIDEVVKDMTDANQKATRQAYEEMKASGMPDGVRIREALMAIEDYQGVSGQIKYKGNNECVKSISIVLVVNGKTVSETSW